MGVMVLAQERTLRGSSQAGARPGAACIRYLLQSTLIRYLLAGTASFSVDFSVYSALHHLAGTDPLIAHLVSRPLGGVTCFLVNRIWTFRASGRGTAGLQFTKFWCVFAVSLFLTEALLALFVRGLSIHPDPAKVMAEGLVLIINFLCLKHWTFR